MNTKEARVLIEYTAWANRSVFAACRLLTPEELSRDLGSSFGSVRGTLFHIVGGEWKWFRFWLHQPHDLQATEEQYPDVAALEGFYADVEAMHAALLAGLSDDLLAAEWIHPRRGTRYTLAQMVQHVVTHGAYHRGQVATLLRQLGHPGPATDFVLFLTPD